MSTILNIKDKPVLAEDHERTLQRQTNSNQLMSRVTSDYKKDDSKPLQIPSVDQKRSDLFKGTSSPTFEINSMQGSATNYKNSQSILDVFTELSLVTEEGNKPRLSANPGQASFLDQSGNKSPQDCSAKMKIQLSANKKQLSPFTPIEGEKVGLKSTKKHGLSEYNRRSSQVGGNCQESAFNYRKETQGEEELAPQDENSCTEIDLMHHKGDQNQVTSSNDADQVHKTPKDILGSTYMQSNELILITKKNESTLGNLKSVRKAFEQVANEQVLQEEADQYMLKTLLTTSKTIGQRLTHYQPHPKVNPFTSQQMQTFAKDGRILTPPERTKLDDGCPKFMHQIEQSEWQMPNINIEIKIEPSTTPVMQAQKAENNNAYKSFQGYASFFTGQANEPQADQQNRGHQLDSEEFMSDDSSFSANDDDKHYAKKQDSESFQQFGMDSIEEGSELHDQQFSHSKIQAMNKMKNKKLKKRLSQKNFDKTDFMEGRLPKDASQKVLQFQYGFSVEQQKQMPDQAFNRVVHFNNEMLHVAKHCSSQSISNLIAQSVKGVTPRVFSKVASQEKLPALPQSKTPFNGMQKQENQIFEQTRQLIKFTEKAAGVFSERSRKFHKPQTLKNLEQKLLHADEDDENDIDVEEFEGPQSNQVINMQMLLEKHSADRQLAYNSEMISINEFEEENKDLLDQGSTEKVNISSEDSKHEKSLVAVFQSNSMADISSPKKKPDMIISQFKPASQFKPIRESMSSPIIMNNDSEAKRCIEEYLCVSRNKIYDAAYFSQNQKTNEQKIGRMAKANTRAGSKSPASAKFKQLVNENMFISLTKVKSLASAQTVAKSMTQMSIQTQNLQESPIRRNLNKQQLKELVPIVSRLVGSKTNQNISMQLPEYRPSSKTPSIIVQSVSPYKSVCKKSKQKGKVLQSQRVSTKKTSTTQTNIHRSSVIGKNLENNSSYKEGKNSSLQKQNTFTGSSQKTKQPNHGQSLSRLTGQHPSNAKSAHKTMSSGKTSIANLSSKVYRNPPCQPTLITSPVQKIETGERLTLSLRVLQTSSALATSNFQTNIQSAGGTQDFLSPKHRLGTYQQKGGSAQTVYPMSTIQNETQTETLLLRDYLSKRDRLATVSSHRSFHSQGKSAGSNYGQKDFSKQSNPIVNHSETVLLSFTPQTFNEKDKEAYESWKEATMRIKPNVLSAQTPVILPRSNSVVNRRSPLPTTSKRLLKRKWAKPSIFDVEEDRKKPIVRENSEQNSNYGISKSPNIRLRKKHNIDGVFLQFDSPKLDPQFIVSDRKNNRLLTAEQKSKINQTLPQLLLRQHFNNAKESDRGANEDGRDILVKKNYNLQLVPKEPLDSNNIDNSGPFEIETDDEDELPLNGEEVQKNRIDQCKGNQNFTPSVSLSALMDSNLNNVPDQSTHALQIHKQKTPFKNRLWQQHQGMINETSVEVLKLDASEFTQSDQEITKSNLLSLRSEELLCDNLQAPLQKGINSTYQYIAMHGEIPQWRGRQGGVLSADNVCIIQEEQLSNNEAQYDMPDKAEPTYPMSLPESESLPSGSLSYHNQQAVAKHQITQQRRGSAAAPLTSNLLLSANSLTSFGRTEIDQMQTFSHRENLLQQRTTILDDKIANCDDNYLAIHNKMPYTKHPQQQTAARGAPNKIQIGESFMSVIPSQKDHQAQYQPLQKTISLGAKTQSNRKSQYSKKKSKKGKVKTNDSKIKGPSTSKAQNMPLLLHKNFDFSMPLTFQLTQAENANTNEIMKKDNTFFDRKRSKKSQRSGSVSLNINDKLHEHQSRASVDSIFEHKPNTIAILQQKDQSDFKKQGTFGQVSLLKTSMILQQSKIFSSVPSQVHDGKRSVGNTSSKTTSRKSSIPFSKTSLKPNSPSRNLIMTASAFPKKVSLNLLDHEMKSGTKFKLVNRTQTGTPMATKSNKRTNLKDFNNAQSARATYSQTVKEVEERKNSIHEKQIMTAGPQFKTRNMPMQQLTENLQQRSKVSAQVKH